METPAPDFTGATNGELVDYVAALRETLCRCNADKKAVRTWQEDR